MAPGRKPARKESIRMTPAHKKDQQKIQRLKNQLAQLSAENGRLKGENLELSDENVRLRSDLTLASEKRAKLLEERNKDQDDLFEQDAMIADLAVQLDDAERDTLFALRSMRVASETLKDAGVLEKDI